MTIYEHRATVTASAGSIGTTTLSVVHGLLRQLYVVANTSTTVFMVTLVDTAGLTRRKSQIVTGEYSDITYIPVSGYLTVNIINASLDDTFKVYAGVEE